MGDLQAYLATLHWVFDSFLPKKIVLTLCPIPPIHPASPQATSFLFPQMKNVLKGKQFGNMEEVK